ncbi:MAG: hypothetical protein WC980_00360 [Candidatus Brocadiia bacterium]
MFYEEVFRAFNKAGVEYLVAGGVATVLHGFARFTADLDITIHLSEKNIDRFFDAIAKLGYQPRLPVTKEQFKDENKRQEWIKTKNMKVFSFFHPKEHLKTIDVFIKEPIRFDRMAKAAKKIRIKNIAIPVLSINHLILLKKKAGRPQDRIDVANLKEIIKIKRRR